jgi:hypothetical protein
MPLVSILCEAISAIQAARCQSHHLEEGAVEREVVTITEKVIVTSERSVGLEFVMPIKTRFLAGEYRVIGCPCGSITADGELLGLPVTARESQAEESKKRCQIVTNIVQVLLSIDELVEGSDTVMGQEAVISSDVQTGTGAMNIIRPKCNKIVCSVSWGRDLISTLSIT